jgi:hypothetical protein
VDIDIGVVQGAPAEGQSRVVETEFEFHNVALLIHHLPDTAGVGDYVQQQQYEVH